MLLRVMCADTNIVCRWLYQLIVTIDANYRLKLKDKGLVADKPLGDGWSHFVQTAPYRAYIQLYGGYVEVRELFNNQAEIV